MAVGALVACTKSEVKFDDASEIAFAPVASTATKAANKGAIDGAVYPAKETFRVWGYWQRLDAGTDHSAFVDATSYIDNKVFSVGDNGLWKGKNQSYYWPKTGSMVFACLSPADAPVTELRHSVTEDNFSFYYPGTDDTGKTVDIMWTDCTQSVDENNGGNGVYVKFNHALTWITFKVKGDAVTKGEGFVINSLVIDKVYTGGRFNSNTKTWGDYVTDLPIKVFEGNSALKEEEYGVLENNKAGTLIVPQYFEFDSNYYATLNFTNNLGDTPIQETVKLDLGSGWEIGKHYTYYVYMTAKEIQIVPEVTEWDKVDSAGTTIF